MDKEPPSFQDAFNRVATARLHVANSPEDQWPPGHLGSASRALDERPLQGKLGGRIVPVADIRHIRPGERDRHSDIDRTLTFPCCCVAHAHLATLVSTLVRSRRTRPGCHQTAAVLPSLALRANRSAYWSNSRRCAKPFLAAIM